ncbi:MAG: hypothetical protein ACYC2I_12115 [Elusimicrobiales bacterium]
MVTPFPESLVKLRKADGFGTAYRFFHDSGGQPVLKITCRKYLLREQGRALPPIETVTRLAPALKLMQKSGALGSLVASWLKTMAGGGSFPLPSAAEAKKTGIAVRGADRTQLFKYASILTDGTKTMRHFQEAV